MTPDFSEFKKFPPYKFSIIRADIVLELCHHGTGHHYLIEQTRGDWILSECNFNTIKAEYRRIYRRTDLYRLLRLVGYDPERDYHAWKRGDFDALVQRLQNS